MSNLIPKDLLDDLCSRFILNVPNEGKKDDYRICFNIEFAYWYYLDFYCPDDKSLPKCSMVEFSQQIFSHVPSLKDRSLHVQEIISKWKEYKHSIPTYGAIILDEAKENVLLVQGFWAKATWGFPKGKVNEAEKPHDCAIREVFEETGFDISKLIKEDEYLEHIFNDQLIRLYIISGVSTEIDFKPRTRCEIKSVKWFKIANLPTNKKDDISKHNLGIGANSFFMVMPFVKQIRKWISNNMPGKNGKSNRNRSKAISESMASNKEEMDARYKRQQEYFQHLSEFNLKDLISSKESRTNEKCSSPNLKQDLSEMLSPNSNRSKSEKLNKCRNEKRFNRLPPRFQKLKHRMSQNQLEQDFENISGKIQILKRDSAVTDQSGNAKKNLASIFDSSSNIEISIELCEAWKNFKFNIKPIHNSLLYLN